jgi:high-affinity nickel-transport protein
MGLQEDGSIGGMDPGAAAGGFGFGLLVTAFWFGFRHGIDWDHIAAITDITSSQDDRRRAIWFGTLYVLGHAAVVLALGVLAIVAGDRLPASVDEVMGRVVGATLILLGVYVFTSLIRHGRDFRLRSRWMLVFAGVRRGARWVRTRTGRAIAAAAGGEGEPLEGPADPARWHHGHHGRPGHHHHEEEGQHEPFVNYGRGTAFGVGTLHGIGAETPTQVLIFLAAAGAGGPAAGIAVLVAFIVGLVAANSIITVGSALGFLSASGNFAVYAAVAVLTGIFSLAIGTIFLLGAESILPAFFSG